MLRECPEGCPAADPAIFAFVGSRLGSMVPAMSPLACPTALPSQCCQEVGTTDWKCLTKLKIQLETMVVGGVHIVRLCHKHDIPIYWTYQGHDQTHNAKVWTFRVRREAKSRGNRSFEPVHVAISFARAELVVTNKRARYGVLQQLSCAHAAALPDVTAFLPREKAMRIDMLLS